MISVSSAFGLLNNLFWEKIAEREEEKKERKKREFENWTQNHVVAKSIARCFLILKAKKPSCHFKNKNFLLLEKLLLKNLHRRNDKRTKKQRICDLNSKKEKYKQTPDGKQPPNDNIKMHKINGGKLSSTCTKNFLRLVRRLAR